MSQTKRLASEALLRFTARRTTEWFREEVRLKGGLDHIISLGELNYPFISLLRAHVVPADGRYV